MSICKKNNIFAIFFIQFYIINGFGPDWIIEFRNLLLKKFSKNKRNITINMKAGYAIEEGLKFFEGMINIKRSHNGSLGNRSYRIKKIPLSKR